MCQGNSMLEQFRGVSLLDTSRHDVLLPGVSGYLRSLNGYDGNRRVWYCAQYAFVYFEYFFTVSSKALSSFTAWSLRSRRRRRRPATTVPGGATGPPRAPGTRPGPPGRIPTPVIRIHSGRMSQNVANSTNNGMADTVIRPKGSTMPTPGKYSKSRPRLYA